MSAVHWIDIPLALSALGIAVSAAAREGRLRHSGFLADSSASIYFMELRE